MKQLLDFLPLVVFFVVYKLYDIFVASGALIAASAIALIAGWVIYRKVEKISLVTFALVAVFGTLTIALHNPDFVKWKVTILYGLFTIALLFSHWFMEKPLIQKMLGKEIELPEFAWRRLNIAWALFFCACGLANIYVAFWMSQDAWMNFKVFGLTALTLLFTLLSGVYIYRLMPQEEK